jgi:hypothetical protein
MWSIMLALSIFTRAFLRARVYGKTTDLHKHMTVFSFGGYVSHFEK